MIVNKCGTQSHSNPSLQTSTKEILAVTKCLAGFAFHHASHITLFDSGTDVEYLRVSSEKLAMLIDWSNCVERIPQSWNFQREVQCTLKQCRNDNKFIKFKEVHSI